VDGFSLYRAFYIPNKVDPYGKWGDDGHGGMPNLDDGNGGNEFNWTAEDYGWSSPFNPFSTWRHFRDLADSESDLAEDVEACDKSGFESHMHQMQDYYSHYSQGYRWWLGGHAFDGTAPDDIATHQAAYQAAQQRTEDWLRKWFTNCCKVKGVWTKWTTTTCCDKKP